MKIKTSAYSAFIFLTVVVLSFVIFKWRIYQVIGEEKKEIANVYEIWEETVFLNGLTIIYADNFSEDARQQWLARHDKISQSLSSSLLDSAEQIKIIAELRQKNDLISGYFVKLSQITSSPNPSFTSEPAPAVVLDERQRLSRSALSELSEMMKLSATLYNLTEADRIKYDNINSSGDFAFVLILFLAVFFAIVIAVRRVIRPAAKLYRALRAVIGNELDRSANFKSLGEIDQLSGFFDVMAEKLKTSYSSLEKKVEERTRQFKNSEQSYRRLFEAAKDGILLIDFNSGIILDVNQFLIDLLGFSKGDFLKKHLWEVGSFNDVVASKENFKKLQEKKYVRFEDLPLLTKNGDKIAVEFISNVYDVGGVEIIQANIRDIRERKKEAEDRRIIEDRFRALAELAPVGIYLADLNGNYLYVNPFWCKMAGLNENQALGQGWVNSIHPKDRKMVVEKWQQMADSNGEHGLEYRFQAPTTGKITTVYALAAAQYGSFGRVANYVGVNLDITDRKIAENELKKNAGILEESQKIANFGSYDLDILSGQWTSTKTLDNVVGIGDSYERTRAGWFKNVIHPDERERVFKYFNGEVLGKGKNFDMEYKIIRQYDGAERWVHCLGKLAFDAERRPIRMVGTIQDITERKNTELAILALKERDETILASIGDAVVACDNSGKIILFNREAERLSGFTTAQAIGKKYREILNFTEEYTDKPTVDFIGETIASGKFLPLSNHLMIVRKDGLKIAIADAVAPVLDASGKISGCVVIFHDATKERKIDRAKTEFVSLASHQLRTPLTSIVWFTEMLSKGNFGKISAKQKEGLDIVHNSGQRMADLIGALLNISRLELGTFSINPKPISVFQAAEQSLLELRARIKEKKLKIKKIRPPRLPPINADPTLLKIIWQNLIANAVNYCSPAGAITVAVEKNNTGFILTVSDNGIGIPVEDQANIFTKFFRANNAQLFRTDGSGLGLYIVKLIIDAVGGKIWFDSSPGKGTSFYVSLPLGGMMAKSGAKQLEVKGKIDSL